MALLTFQSQPGDHIGGGLNFNLLYGGSPPSGSAQAQVRRTFNGQPAELLFVLLDPGFNIVALLFFGTEQLGIPMQPGVYLDAQRADFAAPGHPGLDVGFQGRGCNIVTGSFIVTGATFGANNSIESFAATFTQHCEGATPALFGTFTYSANGILPPPTTVPEPGSLGLLLTGLLALAARTRRGLKL